MKLGLENKKVFVTGASGGIGQSIYNAFVEEGATVIAPTRSEMDLSDRTSVDLYISTHDMDVDVFVHCAGINKLAGIDDVSPEILEQVFNVNYLSAVLLSKATTNHMKEAKWGKVIFISSLYSVVSRERRIAYASSKTALTGLCKTLALELAPYNISVNEVAPGYVKTSMTTTNLSMSEIKKITDNIPMGRLQFPEEIADTVLFLCSERNKSITGQKIVVDGGFLCR